MAAATTSRLAGLRLVNPHREAGGWRYDAVTAGVAAALPSASSPLEVSLAGAGRLWTLSRWLEQTHATALLVVDRGRLVHEWYAADVEPTDLLLGASMTKSVLAHLVGVAVRAGALTTDDLVTSHVPALAGSGYARCTVEHLLTMTSGVAWVEDHRDPASPASRLLGRFVTGSGGSRELLRSVAPRHEPGTRFEYCTADSQVLDWVREAATGSTYQQALGELWRRLGCADDAVVATDGATDGTAGTALAGGGLAATARDWA
ncbi:MAG: serine hydrolase domain-containing protein, partial [Nocardioidaceae bacterium]